MLRKEPGMPAEALVNSISSAVTLIPDSYTVGYLEIYPRVCRIISR